MRLHVGNVPFAVTEEDLEKLFEKNGNLLDCGMFVSHSVRLWYLCTTF